MCQEKGVGPVGRPPQMQAWHTPWRLDYTGGGGVEEQTLPGPSSLSHMVCADSQGDGPVEQYDCKTLWGLVFEVRQTSLTTKLIFAFLLT